MTDQILDIGTESVETPAAETSSLLDSFGLYEQPEVPAEEAAPEAGEDAASLDFIPEQYRVYEGEQLNLLASTQALAKAYAERAAFGDVPEEYAAPEGAEEKWAEMREIPAVKEFADEARKLGMTNAQFNFALHHISAAERDGRNFAITHQRTEAENALRAVWSEPETFDSNLRAASAAVRLLVPEADRQTFGARYGNDPVLLQLLARVGSEMAEDPGVNVLHNAPTGEDVQSLMRSDAYRDSNHPDHRTTHAKVARYYEKHYGTHTEY